jgi:hypothetical protein
MRLARLLVCALLAANSPASSATGSSTSNASQASVLIQQSLAALTGGQTLTDVTLTGSAQTIAGSDNETGNAVLKAVAAGASSLALTLTAGPRTEVLNASVIPPSGSRSGPDGSTHVIPYHNLLTGPSWFFPAFSLSAASSVANNTVTYVGQETHNGATVQHLTIIQSAPVGIVTSDPLLPHLTQLDFYLDSTTLLPVAVDFTIHPDDNELADVPVEIRFASYTTISGAQIPFHVQRFINNSLALDLQIQNAVLNSGITISQVTGH